MPHAAAPRSALERAFRLLTVQRNPWQRSLRSARWAKRPPRPVVDPFVAWARGGPWRQPVGTLARRHFPFRVVATVAHSPRDAFGGAPTIMGLRGRQLSGQPQESGPPSTRHRERFHARDGLRRCENKLSSCSTTSMRAGTNSAGTTAVRHTFPLSVPDHPRQLIASRSPDAGRWSVTVGVACSPTRRTATSSDLRPARPSGHDGRRRTDRRARSAA